MLKSPLNFLRQRFPLFKKTIDSMTSKAAANSLDKRPEETIIDATSEMSNKKQKTEGEDETAEVAKISKRKYALLIGYCGEGYYGLQRNCKQTTEIIYRAIEDEIVEGLVKINAIPQDHADEMYKMSFQRAARTDKGVSAAANLISLKMQLADDFLEKINETLPKQIRVFGYNKVTQSFCCKQNCDARTYIYILPTFAFCPVEEILQENYRASDEVMKRVNEILSKFVGTHNFHNFTSGKKYTDPSAKRYIYSFECSKPFMKEGYEFAVIKIKGQSFMLHQIRKMVGTVIAIVRGYAGEDLIQLSRTAFRVDVPQAPALGLMLDQLHYDKYDRKFGKDGVHKPIQWPELADEMEKFKHEYIFKNIVEKEIQDKNMFKWLGTMPLCHYGPMDPLFMRYDYTGIQRASYLLSVANGTDRASLKKDNEEDEEKELEG